MESGLEGRNNPHRGGLPANRSGRLNGVRPRRPEQWSFRSVRRAAAQLVSMESGLEGRNNEALGEFAVDYDVESQWSPA